MDVSSIGQDLLSQSLQGLLGTSATQAAQPSAGSAGAQTTRNGASQAQFSPLSSLLNELQKLQSADPTKFKQLVTQIAGELKQAAQQAGSSPQGQYLASLASEFQQVAQSGSLSSLQTPAGAASSPQAAYAAGRSQGATSAFSGHHLHRGGAVDGVLQQATQQVQQALAGLPGGPLAPSVVWGSSTSGQQQ